MSVLFRRLSDRFVVKWWWRGLAVQTYLWLGLEALAHGAEDVNLAGGQAGGVGGFACHDAVWFVLGLMC